MQTAIIALIAFLLVKLFVPKTYRMERGQQVALVFVIVAIAPISATLFTSVGLAAFLIVHAIARGLSLSGLSLFLDQMGKEAIIAMFVGTYVALLVNGIRQLRQLG
jgi:hypothetical protein